MAGNAFITGFKPTYGERIHRSFLGWIAAVFVGIPLLTTPCAHAADDPALLDIERKVTHGYATNASAPQRVNGRMAASKSPDLDIKPKMEVLGKRVVELA